MRRLVVLLLALGLGACAERTEPYRTAPQPDTAGYRSVPVGTTAYDNTDLASLLVQLSHGLENGAFRKALQRFEAPVNVGFVGPGADQHRPFLRQLLAEIRTNTGIRIEAGPAPHNLLVRMIPGEEFLPETNNQCIVLFGQPTWQEFRANPEAFSGQVTQTISEQTEMGVLIPDTIEPFKVRECLLEEITQALGTANDLFGLGSTIFNDDNAHAWPTKLDYLMLRVLYDPRLKSGMDAVTTRDIARQVLDEVNPEGRGAPRLPSIRQYQFQEWRRQVFALDAMADTAALWHARKIADEAETRARDSAYHCTGQAILASVASDTDAPDALSLMERALDVCGRAHGAGDIRIAGLRLVRAYHALNEDREADAKRDITAILPTLMAHGVDDKIAAAKIGLATIAKRQGDPDWQDAPLAEARQWSAFAFGDDHELTRQLSF